MPDPWPHNVTPHMPRKAGNLPRPVLRKNVVAVLYHGVAREPALGVVSLRWAVGLSAGLERSRGGVILEFGISPSAAVREPLAVFHHEINVMLSPWHRRLTR